MCRCLFLFLYVHRRSLLEILTDNGISVPHSSEAQSSKNGDQKRGPVLKNKSTANPKKNKNVSAKKGNKNKSDSSTSNKRLEHKKLENKKLENRKLENKKLDNKKNGHTAKNGASKVLSDRNDSQGSRQQKNFNEFIAQMWHVFSVVWCKLFRYGGDIDSLWTSLPIVFASSGLLIIHCAGIFSTFKNIYSKN